MRVVIVVVGLMFQTNLWASDIRDVLSGTRMIIGLTAKSTDLDVQDPDNPFNVYGVLTQADYQYYPLLSFYTPDRYLNESSNWGWFIELGWKNYSLDHQSDPSNPTLDPVDLGTSARGSFFHITPVFFYNWGDRYIGAEGGQSFKFGIGLGFGYLSTKGTVNYSETDGLDHTFDVAGFGMAINVMMDYRYNNWYVRAIGGGPAISRNNVEYEIFDFSMEFGYIYTFK
jgi:hypothetical protein